MRSRGTLPAFWLFVGACGGWLFPTPQHRSRQLGAAYAWEMLVGVRFPLEFAEVGFPECMDLAGLTVWSGPAAWVWERDTPDLDIPVVARPVESVKVPGWGIDHVVITTPDLEQTVAELEASGADPRRRATVRGRPAAFVLSSVLLEVVEVSDRPTRLWGLALETSHDLDRVVAQWRSAGWEAAQPRAAVQPGRRIFTVAGTALAVMTART